ncbi:LacI family DNA-binding transcriptional regulator (plasmid) [Agrobacterium tumefaciens]|uniref:LacI family DNA-binding transcriptional regulator n=1 Tax=Agrobacterium tumefaciens TaxID=358 RepID=UPI000E0BDC47|nr:LacI family DNA-binding transcriptional regulator [Agrobacterium tumefaciens]WQE43536.1 LacI family DNA-binding transcriptional regulator [Agrobacterium tumefaciens]
MSSVSGRRATIIDVAKRAGVSKSTVARVLGGSPKISEEARERVLKAVKFTGYEPNQLAAGTRSGRSGLLAIVIPDVANPFWAEVARGAQDRAAVEDISLLIFSSDWEAEKEATHLRSLRRARVDGAIINPVADSFDDLGRFGLPFVLIGSSAERFPDTSSVGSDIAQAVRLGMDVLTAHGHAAPALLLGPRSRLARARFLRAVHEHCIERDFDPALLPMEEAEYTVDGGREGMTRLLARKGPGHLAVFAANDLMALGAMMAVREAGLRCPEDVSILGFDGIPAGAFSWPGLTTIEKPGRLIGIRAVECLLDEVAGRPEHGRVYMPCRLIERGSLADLSVPAPIRVAAGR